MRTPAERDEFPSLAESSDPGEAQLLAIAEFVRQVGSLEKAQQILDALSEVERAA
ncbi:MAG: hypothetical protein KY475_18565 [Planctomycetes bacterium]|nr:hypothetical protein [Planctomycetota bacterium]